MAYEAEEVYEYDDPLEIEFEQLKNEAGQKHSVPCSLFIFILCEKPSIFGLFVLDTDL